MADLKTQRRLAASVLKVGLGKVWMDPKELDAIAAGITRVDIKGLISDGKIRIKREQGASSYRVKKRRAQRAKGRRRGPGKRKGAKGARFPAKKRWISTIRPLRHTLKKLRDEEKIDKPTYRRLYLMAKGGMFKSRSHLDAYLTENKLLRKGR